MEHKNKKLAPEPYFIAYLYVMRRVILYVRMWNGDKLIASPQQTCDLMDAIHNISDLLYCYEDWDVHENIRKDLIRYDKKWANSQSDTGIAFGELLDRAITAVEKNGHITKYTYSS